jgi:protein TonB
VPPPPPPVLPAVAQPSPAERAAVQEAAARAAAREAAVRTAAREAAARAAAARTAAREAAARDLAARAAAARAAASTAGSSVQASQGQNAASRAGEANNGAAWMGKLQQWWDQHSFYPKEASQTNEGGSVRVRIIITPDGQVTSIGVVQGSGSSVLDAAALAVFRNAHLPPFPPGTPAPAADVVVTLHYRPSEGG